AVLEAFRFEDAAIIVPELNAMQKEHVIARTEREFATVDEEHRTLVANELAQTIIAQFLEQLRFEYAMKMNEAKQQKDEEKELQYLALLQKLHQHRHAP
ncbi:MAG: hypothetical protein V4478_00565, partial [Patescibacteria group bacterium]